MKNRYETVFILTPVLSEDQMKDAVEKFKQIIDDNGEIVNEETWGLRKLAYPIDKKKTGFYMLYEFEAEPTFVEKLETEYRRDDKLLRYSIVKLDKYGIEFNERRRRGEFNKKEEKEEA